MNGASIDRARSILDLGDDWDGEGSPGYSPATFDRAAEFVRSTARGYYSLRRAAAPVPRISHGPESSIDILWQHGDRKVLVNIPDDPQEPGDFYGYNGPAGKETVKGTFTNASPKVWLLIWLTE